MSKKFKPAPVVVVPITVAPDPELPIIPAISMIRVTGGFAVLSMEVQGNRVLSKQVHTSRAESREYASAIFKQVAQRKIFFPDRGPVVNLE